MRALSSRETDVLLRLASFRFLTRAQLEEFVFDGTALRPSSKPVLTKRLLRALIERRLVGVSIQRIGGPLGGPARVAYFLTGAGEQVVGALRGEHGAVPHRVRSDFFVGHALATAEVALTFRRAARSRRSHALVRWEADWEIGGWLREAPVVPDAYLVYATPSCEIHAFIEVDLGTERPARFAHKIRGYVALYRNGAWRSRLATWPVVLVVTPDLGRASTLRHASETVLRVPHDDERLASFMEFDFAPLADLVGPSGPLGAIWQVTGRSGLQPLVTDAEAADRAG